MLTKLSLLCLSQGIFLGIWVIATSAQTLTTKAPATEAHRNSGIELKSFPKPLSEAKFLSSDTGLTVSLPPETIGQSDSSPIEEISATPTAWPARASAQFSTGPGVGYSSSYGSFAGFIPLIQTPGESLTFFSGQLLLATDGAKLGGSITLGERFYDAASNREFGGYVAYDNRDTGNNFYNQIGVGVETLGDWDARINGYFPVGTTRNQLSEAFPTTAPVFQGNSLLLSRIRQFEAAFTGVDAEFGGQLLRANDLTLRGYGGIYYINAPSEGSNRDAVGFRARLEARPTDYLLVGLTAQTDPLFNTTVVVNLGVSFPGTTGIGIQDQDSPLARMGDFVTRQSLVAIDNQTISDRVSAINPATGQPYRFQQVVVGNTGGNGTFENPFGSVQDAVNATVSDGNNLVYVQPGSGSTPGFTIPSQVQVLSSGLTQFVSTVQQGTIQLPLSGTTALPRVAGTVTFASNGSNQGLSGFNLLPQSSGVVGTNLTNPAITNNTISIATSSTSLDHGIFLTKINGNSVIQSNTITNSAAGSGIVIQGATGNTTIANNIITTSAPINNPLLLSGKGIFVDSASGTTSITGNRVTNALDVGILLQNATGNALIANNTVLGTRQPNPRTGLDANIFFRTNQNGVNLTISGNTVGDSNSPANIGGVNTNEIDGIEVSICRSYTNAALPSPIASSILLANCNGPTSANVNLVGNWIRNIANVKLSPTDVYSADGFDINLNDQASSGTSQGARGNITISSNQVENIASKGITYGADGDAIVNLAITDNTPTSSVNPGNIPGFSPGFRNIGVSDTAGSNGLSLRLRANSVTPQLTVTNNLIQNYLGTSDAAIAVTLTQATNNAKLQSALISNNVISGSGTDGIAVTVRNTGQVSNTVISNNKITGVARNGIYINAREGAIATVTVSNNQVSGSTANGVYTLAQNNAQLSTSIKGNNVLNNNTGNTATNAGLTVTAQNTSNLCLQLQNNQAGTTSTTGYLLTRTGTSTFTIENSLLLSNTGFSTPSFSAALPATFTSVTTGTCGF